VGRGLGGWGRGAGGEGCGAGGWRRGDGRWRGAWAPGACWMCSPRHRVIFTSTSTRRDVGFKVRLIPWRALFRQVLLAPGTAAGAGEAPFIA